MTLRQVREFLFEMPQELTVKQLRDRLRAITDQDSELDELRPMEIGQAIICQLNAPAKTTP